MLLEKFGQQEGRRVSDYPWWKGEEIEGLDSAPVVLNIGLGHVVILRVGTKGGTIEYLLKMGKKEKPKKPPQLKGHRNAAKKKSHDVPPKNARSFTPRDYRGGEERELSPLLGRRAWGVEKREEEAACVPRGDLSQEGEKKKHAQSL